MSKLTANIDELTQASQSIQSVLDELANVVSGVTTITGEMETTWDGAACDEYIKRMRNHIKSVNSVKKMLVEMKKYLDETAETLRKLDEIINRILHVFSFDSGFGGR